MKLYPTILKTKCFNCKENFTLKQATYSRMELENMIGTVFTQQCPHCLKSNDYHVNEVKAYKNKFMQSVVLIFALTLLLVSVYILWQKGFIATLSIVLPITVIIFYNQSVSKQIYSFNKHFIDRRS